MQKGKFITLRGADSSIINMEIFDALPSTSELAREYAKRGYPDRYVVFAEKRIKPSSAHSSTNEYETGVYMSCILRPSLFPSQASLLGALSATALATALEEHTTNHIGMGWISDVYCNGVRIGKTSIEAKLDDLGTYEYLIVTFKAKLDQKSFPPRMTDMIRKVFESENTSISMIIARNILSKFFKLYSYMKSSSGFMEVYNNKFILRGKNAKYISDTGKKRCKILGIDTYTGALIIELRHGEVKHVFSQTSIVMPKRIWLKKSKFSTTNS